MVDELDVSDIVTRFLLNTCRQYPRLTRRSVQAAWWCAELATRHPPNDAEVDYIPLTTGSVAEFYIEPMLPLVGDVDVMIPRSDELAIPRGHSPPTQLPAEFSNYVKVWEIVDSHLPGYVYLERRYLLTECSDDYNYNYIETERGLYLVNGTGITDHGPALLQDLSHISHLPLDLVHCIRCPSWPPQATGWPMRHKNYGWPDSATVSHVINNGCDVVGAVHRQCRHDEWMNKHQWRLSFSRAEIVLLNSWMSVQQIVYHMLRVFVKSERLTDVEALSNYHIKTLMMWSCELQATRFWTDLNLIRICVELLDTLSVWLTDAQWPHYFISNCNLVDNSLGAEMIVSKLLSSINDVQLSSWFVKNYIQKSSTVSPENVSNLFSDVSTNTKLLNAVSAIIEWRLNTALVDLWKMISKAEINIVKVFISRLSLQSYTVWLRKLSETNTHLPVYFTGIALLHVAYKISSNGFTDELMDVLVTLTGQFISKRHRRSQCSSEISLSKATKLMKVVANSSCSTMQLIEIELSKAYLSRALRCKDYDSDSIFCLANAYLAVLYYTTGQYQMAIDRCTLVTRSQDHSQCSSHVVQGELLPKIDDDIDNILGLTMFYQYVQTVALNQRQTQHVSVLTTELFAHYLNIRCLSVTQMLSADDVQRFCNYLCHTELFLADVLAAKSVVFSCYYQSIAVHSSQQLTPSAADLNTLQLHELLQQSAVEHLTRYRQLEVQDFGSVATVVTTDFEMLYAYKHGDYQWCLLLSAMNIHTLLCAVRMPVVSILPEFIQLLDDDIVSLTALTLIINPECRDESDYNVMISQLTLSLYLMTQCRLKLRHSVTSLAKTLDCIEVIQRKHPAFRTLDQLTLLLIKRKVLMYVKMMHII